MFENGNESKIIDVNNGKPQKEISVNTVMTLIAAGIGVLSVILVLAILIMLFTGENSDTGTEGGLGGLKNPHHLSDPDQVTAQDIENEYQSRPVMDSSVSEMLNTSIMQFLTKGDFTGLDEFLAGQMGQYKNLEGDEGQSMEDWRSKFELLRSDIAKAINIKKDSQPDVTFTQFASSEILAATVVWSPASVKLNAFADWSSLILPVPRDGDVFLHVSNLENPNKILEEINAISSIRYYDFSAYDMTIAGHNLRLYIVGDQYGYYQPWTLFDLDHRINQDVWTKSSIIEVKNTLDPWSDLDSVLGALSSFADEEISSADQNQTPANSNVIPPDGQVSNDRTPEYLIPEGEGDTEESRDESVQAGDDATAN